MNKKITFIALLFSFMLSTFGGIAQTSKNNEVISLAGAELGVRSGVFYEQRLSRSFSLVGSAGYGIGTGLTFHSGFSYTGIRPVLAIAPRWYFLIPDNNTQNNAPYITFEVSYSPETGAFLLPKDINKREKWNLGTVLAIGYRHSVAEKLMLKSQLGVSLNYTKLHTTQGFFDRKDWKSKSEIVFDLGLIYTF